jgi:hypothetical protein
MKTILVISTIGFLAWGLQLSLWEIPKLQEKIAVYQKSEFANDVLAEGLKEKNEQLNVALAKIKELEEIPTLEPTIVVAEPINEEPEPESEPEIDNSPILAQIEDLLAQKEAAQKKFNEGASQIEEYIQKGQTLLAQQQAVKPNFKDGNIRTSDADRLRWQQQQDSKINFYKSEIGKLEAQKQAGQRSLDSLKAQIDLQIMQLRREIK